MLDALADITEPQAGKTPSALSSVVSAQEAKEAVSRAFPYEGDLRVRCLWSRHGSTSCRANWFRRLDGEMRVVKSLFLGITKTQDSLVVRDETAG